METSVTLSEDQIINRESELLAHVSMCVARQEEQNIDITAKYEDWLKVGFALTSELGEAGRPLFHRISKLNETYNFEEADKFYTGLLNRRRTEGKRITIATLFMMFKNAGIDIKKDDTTESN